MSMFSKIRRHADQQEDERHRLGAVECQHRTLLPRWDSVDDMGKQERASAYQCEACEQTFTPAEAGMLRESAQQKLHELDVN